jgi:chromate reductase
MSASIGMLGGANAQFHLRQTCVFLNVFDANGKLLDDNTKKFLGQLLENLAKWTRKLAI